ncbi:MAG TPA: mannosyltransferase family protein [Anaeromyxobacteraceae bacterium]|nr:mannosyltransferase family protein [Anaeromyxobacteraceae bacterium]
MFLRAVLLPFAWTRLLLAGVAWFGDQASVSWSYPNAEAARRGWEFVPWTWLDAFGRWDAGWYLDIARNGYALRGPLGTVQSNVAFFPLYPWTVRAVQSLLPGRGEGSFFVAALIVSNAAALAGLWLLWRLARDVTGDDEAASRAVLYALLFPFGFVLSSAYPESLFLALSAGSLLAAGAGRHWLAGVLGMLLALTRPGGVLVAVPLAWIAGERGGRRLPALAASALPGLGALAHLAWLWRLTGDPLALFHVQGAWGRRLAAPWETLLSPREFHARLGPLEALVIALVAATGAWLLARRRTRALGVWALVSLVPVLLSGTFLSSVRFGAVAFPAFVALATIGRNPALDRAVVAAFSFGQAILFFFWTRWFWVG